MIGVVLAAGSGGRMRPLAHERAKPLLPLLDLPLAVWAFARLGAADVSDAWINAHFDSEEIETRALRAAKDLGMKVGISRESSGPLGTAGALRNISEHLTEAFVVMNADVACNAPIERLIEAHRSAKAMVTLLTVATDDQADFVLDQGWVADVVDRRDQLRAGHQYGGIGIFEPEILDAIPAGVSGLYETVLRPMILQGRSIAAFEWQGYWMDVGTPSAYLAANLDALSGAIDDAPVRSLRGKPFRRDAQAYVGEGASVDDVELRHSVVGSGARVAPGTRLVRSIVWDGVAVPKGEYRESILTKERVVTLR